MCGISAVIGTSPPSELETLARHMLSVIPHRGPDGEGTLSGPGIALGHKRLSIVDLSDAGAQPMASQDDRYWITYNGEIYNFPELRGELEREGSTFRSHCDTEIILAAYEKWGEACLSRFNGMFAFVIWDRHSQKAFIARDRFGVKPLYWWKSPQGHFAFASEIKQFTVLPGWRAQLNAQRAYDFLCWAITDHTSETMFKGVYNFAPGTSTTFDLKVPTEPKFKRWYTLEPGSGGDFLTTLSDSVKLRLRADVPVGSCLSGGLDSTSLVALMHEQLATSKRQALQKTFSAVFPGESMDESVAIEETKRQLGIANFQTSPTAHDFARTFEKLVWHQDEPFGSTSIFAQWEVFKLAKANGVTVMLDGQGADEQLAGYHSFFGPHLYGVLKAEGFKSYWAELGALSREHGYARLNLILKTFNHSLPSTFRATARSWLGRQDSNPSWLDLRKLGAKKIDPWSQVSQKIRSSHDFSRALLTSMNLQMLLRYEDRNSMAHSVEARVPFLDYRLVELSLGLGESEKIREGQTKWILRISMAGKIPESIRTLRRKIGFEAPEKTWFRDYEGQPADWPTDLLTPSGKRLIARFMAGKTPFSPLLFRLYAFQAWRRVFNVAS